MAPGRREFKRLIALAILVAMLNFGLYFIVTGILVVCIVWQGYGWLTDGYIPRDKLEQARDKALEAYLPLPGVGKDWLEWAETISDSMNFEEIPGKRNGAVRKYLNDRHDANVMDELLNNRIWPRSSDCNCERIWRRPWDFNHQPTCPLSPDYVDPDTVCSCIKKRRKGKTKVYRSINCPIHGDESDDESDDDEIHITRVGHPLGPPKINKDGEVVFSCGCYALMSPRGWSVIQKGMGCGSDHYEELDEIRRRRHHE